MTFVNQYTKPLLTLRNAATFLEVKDHFLYAVGHADRRAVVIKTRLDGSTVWTQGLSIGQVELRFYDIVQLSGSKGICYVIGAYSGEKFYLVCITTNGQELWATEVQTRAADPHAFILANAKRDGFYFAYSDKNDLKRSILSPRVLHMDADGRVRAQRQIFLLNAKHNGFVLNAIGAHPEGLMVAGSLIATPSVGCTIVLKEDLTGEEARAYRGMTIQDMLVYSAERYVISAYSDADENVVLFQEDFTTPPEYLVVPKSANMDSVLCFAPKGFLLSVLNSSQGDLYFVGDDLHVQWHKGTVIENNELGVRSMSYEPELDRVSFTTVEVPLLGLTGSDFDPCIVQPVSHQVFQGDGLMLTHRLKVRMEEFNASLGPLKGDWQKIEVQPVPVCEDEPPLELDRNASLQSPHLYLQAAGSLGADSTKGIHLRWLLKRALATHLPKADYASSFVNFNKPKDFVRIYRAPYLARVRSLGFTERPQLLNQYEWVYNSAGELFYLYFLDRVRYDQVRASIDPGLDPHGFLTAYGNALLELEHKTRLAFAVQLVFTPLGAASTVDLELRSVEENKFVAPRVVSLRQRYVTQQLNEKKLFSENIRSVRFRANQAVLMRVSFEFYDDFLIASLEKRTWKFIGKYALTKDDSVAFKRLESSPGSVHGNWLRYNDSASVNIDNYRKKWNSGALPLGNRIVETVKKYIDLSNNAANPEAKELIFYNDPAATPIPDFEPEEDFDPSENQFEISNLFLLQIASLDYHVARMLGLGILDINAGIMVGHHVYLAEYVTLADLKDGFGPRQVQHLYMSLPTSLADQRLPLPIDLKVPVPGVVFGADTEAPTVLTDANGYSHDGHTRYLSLFHVPLPEEPENAPFFHSNFHFVSADRTLPVYAGIEYRQTGLPDWVKPELPFDAAWLNVDATVTDDHKQETRPVVIPEPLYPVFVHRERQTGWHDYSSYGINWFSRATPSAVVRSIETIIRPNNLLLPPTNLNAVLVVQEQPLLLTSITEQSELAAITTPDKTFIRLTWDYNHGQELIDYHREINGELLPGYAELPDAEELFAEEIEIYFRDTVPNAIGGKVMSVANATNLIMAVVTTGEYVFDSMGTDPVTGLPVESLIPNLPSTLEPNFIGGLLVVNGINYPIYAIDNSGAYPKFTIFKVDIDGNAVGLDTSIPPSELSAPPVNGLFTAVENMIATNWGAGNPLGILARVEPSAIHREEVHVRQPDGSIDTHVHKFRGEYRSALIEAVLEDDDGDEADGADPGDTPRIHRGLYRLTFTGFAMPQHSQAGGPGHRIEFHNGVVRIHTVASPTGPRKELTVVRTENIGTASDLVLYAADTSFVVGDPTYYAIPIGVQSVNYYPGYRAYLYADAPHNLTEANTLPSGDAQVRYTIFGLRSHDSALGYYSKMSVPALMFAQAVHEPQQPRLPEGGTYATRPDFYGKSTFTFTTVFEHAPYSVQYLRASDIQILRALYTTDNGGNPAVWTVERIQEEIFGNGANEWFDTRWRNLVGLNYTYPANPSNNGRFEELPAGGVALPLPNNPRFIAAINAFVDSHNAFYGTSVPHIGAISSLHQIVIPAAAVNAELQVKDFLQEAIQNCFLPLTEIPIIYQYIKGPSYQLIPKKQVVRDRNGVLLSPSHPDFDMAPMAKRVGPNPSAIPPKVLNETQFTDFNLDGASNAHYFYAVREFNLKMQTSPYSPTLGPVHMVHTAPPRSPEVIKVTPVLEHRNPDIVPAIELRINGYPAVQHIKTLQVYRATNGLDARSLRTMARLPEIDVVETGMASDTIWLIRDDFSDLGYVPYGDPLFYMLTVSRAVEYQNRDGVLVSDVVPSEPSKMVLTNIVENYNPDPPKLEYYSTPVNGSGELEQVTLVWHKKVHNGKYHLYQRNAEGNWIEIEVVQDNSARVVVALATTALGSGTLQVQGGGGNPIYHHFKVVSENFAGMISRAEEILTIHQPDLWQDISTL
ncbi:MAG TPA: hypothetical protein VJ183_09845 [Chloroflexia bacterium]|nr:hypothetical protein [Chloroflexia bacterium]